ncbi:unnamed protein product, partial [Cuscuta campestris]
MDEKEYVLEKPIPPAPPANALKAVKDAYEKHVKDDNQVSCVMLATMITELQKQHEDMKAHEMIVALRQLYQGQSRHERFLGVKQSRRLARGEIELRVGNGAPVAALAIGTYSLVLPSGLMLELNDCLKNVFYANANMTNGLYVLDLDMPVYNISANRNKPNGLNQTYLWHCRTKDAFLVYGGKEELSIVGYTDASFQTDRDDFKSQAG